MNVRIRVQGLPPRKDGALSMWRRQVPRLLTLRKAALAEMGGRPPLASDIRVVLHVHAGAADGRRNGDLDGLLAGVLDGLQSAPDASWEREALWQRPENGEVTPNRPVALFDDGRVVELYAVWHTDAPDEPWYEVVLSGIEASESQFALFERRSGRQPRLLARRRTPPPILDYLRENPPCTSLMCSTCGGLLAWQDRLHSFEERTAPIADQLLGLVDAEADELAGLERGLEEALQVDRASRSQVLEAWAESGRQVLVGIARAEASSPYGIATSGPSP